MSSGIDCTDECVDAFNALKLKHTTPYIIFKITDDFEEIEVLKQGEKGSSYDDFMEELPENACRYAVYDYEFEDDGRKQSKILFVVWAPDSSKIKEKMLYASSKANFKKKLVGIGNEIQATELSEIDEESVKEKVTRV